MTHDGNAFRREQPLPIQFEPDRCRLFVKPRLLLGPRQRLEFSPPRMIRRQKTLLPMQNGRIQVASVIRVPRLPHRQVNRDGMPQDGMGIVEKPWIRKKRNLQLVRPKLDHIELRSDPISRHQPPHHIIQFFPAVPHAVPPVNVDRRRQSLAEPDASDMPLVFLQVHSPNATSIHNPRHSASREPSVFPFPLVSIRVNSWLQTGIQDMNSFLDISRLRFILAIRTCTLKPFMKVKVGTQLEEEVFIELKVAAARQKRPISDLIEHALTDYLRRGQAGEGKAGLARMLAREPFKLTEKQFRESIELDYFDR